MKKKLEKLLLDTPESYYWMGFAMADGSFVGNRLQFGLSIKDENLLGRFSHYIKCDNTIYKSGGKCEFSVMDSYSVPLLREKFDIQKKKTYNPPKTITWMEDDLLYSFIVGFIDGDGSITKQYKRNDAILRIKVHGNWLNILNDISKFISEKADVNTVKAKIDRDGYATINLGNHVLLKSLKSKTLELKLPVLSRKWSIIDLNHINKMERSKYNVRKVKEYMEKGYSNKIIMERLGLKDSTLSLLKKRNGLR